MTAAARLATLRAELHALNLAAVLGDKTAIDRQRELLDEMSALHTPATMRDLNRQINAAVADVDRML
jgi:hypothetical protein